MKRWMWIAIVSLTAIVELLAAWGGTIHPSRVPLALPLLTVAFPITTVFTLIVLGIALFLRCWKSVAMLAVALALAFPLIRTTCPVHLSGKASTDSDTLCLLTINVQGMLQADTLKPDSTMRLILDIGADVVMVQEFKHDGAERPYEVTCPAVKWLVPELDSIYPYRSHTNDDVAILSKYPYTSTPIGEPLVGFETMNYYVKMRHHYSTAYDLQLPSGRQLRIINVHLHSWTLTRQNKRVLGGDTEGEMVELENTEVYNLTTRQKLRRAFNMRANEAQTVRQAADGSPENLIVCGDFNDVPGSYAYRTVRANDLNDAWEVCGCGYEPTYNNFRFYVHIDHVLYRGNLHPVGMKSLQPVHSDHRPQLVTFSWEK